MPAASASLQRSGLQDDGEWRKDAAGMQETEDTRHAVLEEET